jgi:sugar O-acyltransferase (sialic acid O-acetyltransferase NeuD family)
MAPDQFVIYGNGKLAQELLVVMAADPSCRVCAVTADRQHLGNETTFHGLPLVPLELVTEQFPPERYNLIVTIGYSRMRSRRDMFQSAKALGYRMPGYVAPGARLFQDLVMGENNLIFDLAYLGPVGEIGDNNVIRPQVYVGHDFHIDSHSFIASGTTIGSGCRIGQMTFIGLGTTIVPQRVIAEENLISAGSLVTRDTERYGVYAGRPARRVRSVELEGVTLTV